MTASLNRSQLTAMAAEDNTTFWLQQAKRLDWEQAPTEAGQWSWDLENLSIQWFADGKLNVCYNCVDRHLAKRGDHPAMVWQGDDPTDSLTLSYCQVHEQVCRFANVLKARGVGRGDRVIIYMPMVPEAVFAMLACARIGAVHSVVFGGFSPDALANRIDDCQACAVITADEGRRGGKTIALKANVDRALTRSQNVATVLCVRVTGVGVNMQPDRDVWWHELAAEAAVDCPVEVMDAEDPLFILYTSGSTGKPKGVVHTTAGYLLYAACTHEWVFDAQPDDVYWCSADVGWITGHSYLVYGPMANGITTLVFEGVPTYPDPGRFWEVIDRHQVTLFYTAPTAIRALMREGDEYVTRYERTSLRVLGTVGEPINPEAWRWYYEVVGDQRCPIVDTWWQTETGGMMISPMASEPSMKAGSATQPLPGIEPALVDGDGKERVGATEGNLIIKRSWPGQARTLYGDHERFGQTYFSTFPGYYFTGDGARRDEDGDFWITGRVDDVLNVSGHRMGTAEIESALVAHPATAEAAVVGYPHDIKGQGIYCFVILKADAQAVSEPDLKAWVRQEIGPVATPDVVQIADGLPKTRSGKIMRRILRKIAEGDTDQLGDISTLADESVVNALIADARRRR